MFSSLALSTKPTLQPYYSAWSHENLACLRPVRLAMLLQTYFLYPAAVFWAYRPSCLVLTAALAPPPPPLPMHLPLKRQSETTENRKCKHDTGGSDFAGVPPPTSMAQRDLNRLASGLRIQVGVVHINLGFRASTSQRTSNQVPSTNRVGKSVGPARRFGCSKH